MKNKEIAQQLYQIAELLSLQEENPFRIRAYEKAAQVIEALPEAIEEVARKGGLKNIPGIGESIQEKIIEYLNTGKMKYLEELKQKFPQGLLEIMEIPGMGPKKAKIIYDKLKISTIEELEKSAKEGKLRSLPGFGAKTEQNILEGIELKKKAKGRILLFEALRLVDSTLNELMKLKEIENISPAGSLRRKKETIGDIDILCTVKKGAERKVIEKFINLPHVEKVFAAGETKASVLTNEGVQMDLRVLEPTCYGAALQYFTGSKEHNISLRELANKLGLTISEYGVFDIKDKKKPIAGKNEEEVYKILHLQFIPPELREARGEIEIAKQYKLPNLVEIEDLLGETHVHSKYSDGSNTIDEIAHKARQMGLQWVIICDHSKSLKVAGGVSIQDLYKKSQEIKEFNRKSKDVKLIFGAEVDVLSDGTLDYPDEVLKEIDFVIAAIHTGFKQTQEQITKRIINSMKNKYVHAVSHPSGRLIGKRNPYEVNMDEILEYAQKTRTILEINAFPERLDLNDIYSKKAMEMGILLSIGTDAHSNEQLNYLPLGVYVARRAWLEKKHLINTLTYEELLKTLSEIRNYKIKH